jgi:drug/metabolite transporter (DMT)-like permease
LLIGPWLALCAWRGQRVLPRGRVLLLLVLVGLATQLIGNIGSFWALGIIGLTVGIPVVVGVTITSATLLGRIFLGERVAPRSVLALTILLVSIVLLNLGAGDANHAIAAHAPILAGPIWVVSAILVTCAAGLVFGLLSLSIRVAVTNRITPEAAVTVIAILGPLSLAPVAICRSGFQHCLTMSGHDFGLTLVNGLFNTAAFLCLSKGLQRTTIAHANVVNASQIAMATVAGVLLFAEPLGGALIAGVLLTILGVVLMERPVAATQV